MTDPVAAPLPPHLPLARWRKVLLTSALCVAITLVALGVFGMFRSFSVPTGAMAPTISPGDSIVMERFTYLARKPRRGDLAVFKTEGIVALESGAIYVKRIAGEPGDRVRFSDGKLLINGVHQPLRNSTGEIVYRLPRGAEGSARQSEVTVPSDHYYVLGDNSPNSADSRFWGFVPAENILGRAVFCYSPLNRVGRIQ